MNEAGRKAHRTFVSISDTILTNWIISIFFPGTFECFRGRPRFFMNSWGKGLRPLFLAKSEEAFSIPCLTNISHLIRNRGLSSVVVTVVVSFSLLAGTNCMNPHPNKAQHLQTLSFLQK